jgi:hypothetical protein
MEPETAHGIVTIVMEGRCRSLLMVKFKVAGSLEDGDFDDWMGSN